VGLVLDLAASVSSDLKALYKCVIIIIMFIHRPSDVVTRLDHLTCKIVPEMTYNVSSGTLDSTIRYLFNFSLRK